MRLRRNDIILRKNEVKLRRNFSIRLWRFSNSSEEIGRMRRGVRQLSSSALIYLEEVAQKVSFYDLERTVFDGKWSLK